MLLSSALECCEEDGHLWWADHHHAGEMGGGWWCYWLHAALQRHQCHSAHRRAGGERHSRKALRTQCNRTKRAYSQSAAYTTVLDKEKMNACTCVYGWTWSHKFACVQMHQTHCWTLEVTKHFNVLSALLDKTQMSRTEMTFYKATSVWLVIQQTRQKGKYRETLLVKKGWVNHELILPREHHHLFMRCRTQWVRTGIGRCAATRIFLPLFFSKCLTLCHWGVPVIRFPSDLMLFLWSGPLADQSGKWYNWCPAVEVTPQHSLLTLPLRPTWRVS